MRTLLILFLLVSCIDKTGDMQNNNIVESPAGPIVYNEISNLGLLDEAEIIEKIKLIYNLDSVEFADEHNYDEEYFAKVFNSKYIEYSKRYKSISYFKFESAKKSKEAFQNIKSVGIEIKDDRKFPENVELYFGKGGETYIWFNSFIISHGLRCNMSIDDYELDERLALELIELAENGEWLRSYCGWTKMEINGE